jgi:GT2 family glycosyltransferase
MAESAEHANDVGASAAKASDLSLIGVVAIGRNEGQRLKRCLLSVPDGVAGVVYVDSGSTDGSVAWAKENGADVVSLDMSHGFTAARARNAGISRLRTLHADVRFVQVIDGDCELDEAWLPKALRAMDENEHLAVVCGRRREKFPDQTIFNQMVDMEWDTPVGEATACGGDSLIRLAAYLEVGGLDDSLIAGEEPEFCLRLRRAGWRVHRLDAEMTRHDADMRRWSQWWNRNKRSGHAYAEWHHRYGTGPERFGAAAVRSILEWTVVLPMLAIGLAWLTWGFSLLGFGLYALLYRRIRAHRLEHGDEPALASLYARYCMLGKFPQLCGILTYWFNQAWGRRSALIEYKVTHDDTSRPRAAVRATSRDPETSADPTEHPA